MTLAYSSGHHLAWREDAATSHSTSSFQLSPGREWVLPLHLLVTIVFHGMRLLVQVLLLLEADVHGVLATGQPIE